MGNGNKSLGNVSNIGMLSAEMDMTETPKRNHRKQINLDAIMDLDEDKREIILSLIHSQGRFTSQIEVALQQMGIIIDERESNINELLK